MILLRLCFKMVKRQMNLGVTETTSLVGEGSEGRVQDCLTCEAVQGCSKKFYNKAKEEN